MTIPVTKQEPHPAEAEQSAATPVQFLPSTMLSWRTPAMAKLGAPKKNPAKNAAFDNAAVHPQRVRNAAAKRLGA